jgi:hypothetical protein
MKSERVFEFMFCLAVVAQVTFVIAVVSIAWHFLSKWW